MPADLNPQQSQSIILSGDGGIFATSQGSLPGDLLESGRARVRIACLVVAGLWLYVLIMNEGVYRLLGRPILTNGMTWTTPQTVFCVIGLILALVAAWWVGSMRSRPALAIDVGLGFEVATALLVSLVTEWFPRTSSTTASWICILILLYPAIAPASPGKTLVAALAAATMDVLALAVAVFRGVPFHPTAFEVMWIVLPLYVCALLAVVPARVIRGLGRQVRKARELGSYTLEERLGVGGMGEVYRATHRLLARPAAIKLISPTVLRAKTDENRIVIERFRREAEAAATLRSPHTIELYDFGVSDDGTFYYVMELLEGVDLEKLVKRFGPVPPERAIYLLKQACDSLGEAHARGLIHRDLKPSNLFACRMGLEVDYVKVLDFGLVKNDPRVAPEQVRLTAVDAISGTPAFMAPEMIEGDGVGPAADVYALGCVAYWLLTGKFVFQAGNPTAMLLKHLQSIPEAASASAPNPIPEALDALILACLAKAPADRPASAIELGRKLDAVYANLPVWNEEMAQGWWLANLAQRLEPESLPDSSAPREVVTLTASGF